VIQKTLKELKGVILDQVEMVESDFIDSNRLTDWINAEASELHDLLVGAYEDFFICKVPITLIATVENYSLPDDFHKCLGVYWIDAAGERHEIKKFQRRDIGRFSGRGSPSSNRSLKYRILGHEIWFMPSPIGEISGLELWYAPQYVPLVNPLDKLHFSVPVGWEDFIICGATARCLAKEESDVTFWMQKKAEIRDRIITTAPQRDAGSNDGPEDIDGRGLAYTTNDYDWS